MSKAPRGKPVTRACAHCEKSFTRKASDKTARYCCYKCHDDARRTRPKNTPRPCTVCGSLFTPARHRGNARFCSKRCEWIALKGPEFNAKIARESIVERAAKQRGKGTKGYVKLFGRHEHRVVMEKKIGRPLKFEDVVHHKDENKHNNSPDNLELTNRPDHMQMHGLGIPGQKPIWM